MNTASLNWDHTMINVQNIDAAIKFFRKYGILFDRGGRHEKWGTENALGYFGLNYIELISVYDESLARNFPRTDAAAVYDSVQDYLKHMERMNTIAIRTSDIWRDYGRLKKMAIKVSPIKQGQRIDEQNHLITWLIFFIDDDIEGLHLPFFIQWPGTDQDREKGLKKQGLLRKHPAGDLIVKQAVFRVSNPEKISAVWGHLLNCLLYTSDAADE
mgnify:CR=1 FL=1